MGRSKSLPQLTNKEITMKNKVRKREYFKDNELEKNHVCNG